MKKLLYITHFSGLHVNRFWLTSIEAAHKLGYEFHLACNMRGADKKEFPKQCRYYGITSHQIDFERNPLNSKNRTAYKQLLQLMKDEAFDIVHCNTPIGGLLGRLCANKAKVPHIIYQAHGFHFWKGAPLKNKVIYYPVEKFMARYTDTLLTINQEDYSAAKKFKLKKNGQVKYIAGVGIETQKIKNIDIDVQSKRKELGLPADALIFTNIAELIDRKNQQTLMKAFAQADIPNSYLLLCGKGANMQKLTDLAISLHRQEQIKLLGYRTDVMDILHASDCFVFASFQEGLPVALMEAMAAGLPCIASNIRGNTDLLPQSELLFEPDDTDKLAQLLIKMKDSVLCEREIQNNLTTIQSFDSAIVTGELVRIYTRLVDE